MDRTALRRLLLAGLGGVLAALAVVGHVRGWGWVGEAGGRCGSRSGPCPPGTGVALVLGFGGMVGAIVPLATAFTGARTRQLVTAGVCAALTLPAGWFLLGQLHGKPAVEPAWSAPADRPAGTRTLAVWQDGETVVRVRAERIDAYRAHGGELAWSLPARTREAVCRAGSTVTDGVAVVGYGRSDGPCDQLAAVDLRTGRELWRKEGVPTGVLESAGPVAVAGDPKRLTALTLREGGPAWTAPLTEGCELSALTGSAARVAVVEYCPASATDTARGRTWLRTFDTAGRPLWRTDLGAETKPYAVDVVSVDPPTVRLVETDKRGIDAVLALTPDGALRATVAVPTADPEPTGLSPAGRSFPLAPVAESAVVGDLLVTAAKQPGTSTWSSSKLLAAYSLTDGSRKWTRTMEGEVVAVTGTPDGPLVLTRPGYSLQTVHRLDPASGRTVERTDIRKADIWKNVWLGRTADRYLIAHEDGTGDSRPLLGVPRR